MKAAPTVQEAFQLYMQAFWDVASDRVQGSRIRWTAINDWCTRERLSYMQYRDVLFVVTRLDIAYIDWAQTKAKAERKKGKRER